MFIEVKRIIFSAIYCCVVWWKSTDQPTWRAMLDACFKLVSCWLAFQNLKMELYTPPKHRFTLTLLTNFMGVNPSREAVSPVYTLLLKSASAVSFSISNQVTNYQSVWFGGNTLHVFRDVTSYNLGEIMFHSVLQSLQPGGACSKVALRYKPECRGFDSRWGHWILQLT
jgi:hypothetical protein